MVHHLEDIDNAPVVIDPSDQPIAIVPHIKDNAIADLIGGAERLFERGEVGPLRAPGQLVPRFQVTLGDFGLLGRLSGLPEFPQTRLGDNPHNSTDRGTGTAVPGTVIAICDKSRTRLKRRRSESRPPALCPLSARPGR